MNGRKRGLYYTAGHNYSDEWFAPPQLVKSRGTLDLDPCAGPMHLARKNYRAPGQDGLTLPWEGRVWVNPPYSNKAPWADKFLVHGNGLFLCTAFMDSILSQRLASAADAIWLSRGRI